MHTLIKSIVRQCIHEPIDTLEISPASGGSISQSYLIRGKKDNWFIKLNRSEFYPMFMAEAEGLEALSHCASLRVPKTFCLGEEKKTAFLLLEYIQMSPLGKGQSAFKAGQALAQLHQIEGKAFGWSSDNFIGRTVQHNRVMNDWVDFFATQRLEPQLEMAKRQGASKKLLEKAARLFSVLPALFKERTPSASLVHGDLWSGNAALDFTGKLTLFDPAIHYGDRESDLAMSELFGGFSRDFYAGYETVWPLDEGYVHRKQLYQLYHVLNHFNLFGTYYQSQAEQLIDSIMS